MPDLLQGSTPTFDAQAIPDSTDWAIMAAGQQGYGVVSGSAPTITISTHTYTTTASAINLSALTGTGSIPLTTAPNNWPVGGGYVSCPTTGGGTAIIAYTATSGDSITDPLLLNGGGTVSGQIAASTVLTAAFGIIISSGSSIYNQWTSEAIGDGFGDIISLQAPGGGFAALPCSLGGDRKDMVVISPSSPYVASIVQGTACSQVDWTRNNGSYTNPPPVKPAWSSSFPVVLTEIYVPGSGSMQGNTSIAAGNLVDKSLVLVKA